MPALLSHYRPDFPIFAITEDENVQRRLAVYHGVTAIKMEFASSADETFHRYPSPLYVLPQEKIKLVMASSAGLSGI